MQHIKVQNNFLIFDRKYVLIPIYMSVLDRRIRFCHLERLSLIPCIRDDSFDIANSLNIQISQTAKFSHA